MSIEHLRLLQNTLESKKWLIADELPGNNYDISAYWVVSRPSGNPTFTLAFEGLDDLNTLPIEKAYGCHVVNNKEFNLYFGKLGKSFNTELSFFVEAVANIVT